MPTAPFKPRAAHRLDANTSGLVIHGLTRHYTAALQQQFERGEVNKIYLARVFGHPTDDDFSCHAAIGKEASEHGARAITQEGGLEARTDFSVLYRFPDDTALLSARPHTGRTNQIRLHLQHCGYPIVGDTVYASSEAPKASTQTLHPKDPSLCLHAWKISFRHPQTNDALSFETDKPSWAVT